MKKLIIILIVFLMSGNCYSQDAVPADTAFHNLSTYAFRYYTADSSVWIYKGAKYATTKLVSNKRLKFLIDSVSTNINGKKPYHGIQTIGAYSFNNTSHVFTIAAGGLTYWNQGLKYTSTAAKTCDLDDATLVTNKLYFIYFSDTTGVLRVSQTPWNWYTHSFVATVFWNGTEGAIQDEDHSYNRNIPWHKWAHETIGCRYRSGLSLTAPTAAADATLTIESGTISDEDQEITISPQSTMRGWYQVSSGIYTFTNYSLPYLGTAGVPKYLNTSTYTLTTPASNKYICFWVYGSNDESVPIYVHPSHVTAPYNTVTDARAETAPNLQNLPINPEMKILYRFIYKGDGAFQESTDYRGSSPLPSGGSSSTTAGAVSFAPYSWVTQTTVQKAIEQVVDNIITYEIEVSTAGVSTYSVPLALRTNTMVFYNGILVRDALWSGVGTTSLVVGVDINIYDYIKIQY